MANLPRLKQLLHDKRGNALAICAAALPLMIGGAGLAIDSIQISLDKRELQRSADSAAIAGAYGVLQQVAALPAVNRDLEINNAVTLNATPTVENAPTSGPGTGNQRAVRVVLSTSRSMAFLSLFDATPQVITVEATAAGVDNGQFCMLALDRSSDQNVTVSGNATVNLGCGISSNSTGSTAIGVDGSAQVFATPIMAVGGVPTSRGYASGTELLPFSAPQEDPYRGLPAPTPSNCKPRETISSNQTRTIRPGPDGTACFSGLNIMGNVTFEPGTYYINGDALDFGAQARVSGQGVTFVLTSTNAVSDPSSVATLNVNGGAVMNLTSPTSGTFKGVLFYEDPRALSGRTIRYNGNSSSTVEGGFYFPQAHFQLNGDAGMRTECMQLVARRLHFTGNSRIENTCPETSGSRAFNGTYVRLIG